MILWYIHVLSLLFCTPYTLSEGSPSFVVKTETDMVSSWAALADKLVEKTINSANISWWGRRRTHGCLTSLGWQSLRKCWHKMNPNCQAGPDLMTAGQVTSFPGPMMYWSKLDLEDQALVHAHVLWGKNCCTIPNTYPVELIHLWVCVAELCVSLLVVFQPSFSSYIHYRLYH